MPNNAVDVFLPAIDHTRRELFQPFRFGRWARYAVLGILTGELSSGGGNFNPGSFNFPNTQQQRHFQPAFAVPAWLHNPELIALLVVCGLALFFLLVYASCVLRFVLFDAVLTSRCRLREGWRRWQSQGARYFGFQLFMLLAMLVALLPLAAAAFGIAKELWPQRASNLLELVAAIAAAVTFLLALLLVFALVHVLTKDFVVPQMALEDRSVADSWRQLWMLLNAERAQFVGYIGMKIVLNLAAAIAYAIVAFILILLLLIPVLVLIFLLALIPHAGLGWSAATIALAIVAGVVLFAALIFIMGFIGAPVTVFFPAYSMHFFASRYSPLAGILFPPPPPIVPVPSLESS